MVLALSSDSDRYVRVDVYLMSDPKAKLIENDHAYLVVRLFFVHIFIDYRKVLRLNYA